MTVLFSMRIESFPFSKTTFILSELNVGRSLLITLKEAQQACLSLTEHTQRQSQTFTILHVYLKEPVHIH